MTPAERPAAEPPTGPTKGPESDPAPTTTGDRGWPAAWWYGERMAERRRRWLERSHRLLTVEFALAGTIMATWILATTVRSPILLVTAVLLGGILLVATAESGSHVLLWMGTAMVMLLMVVGGLLFFTEFRPVPLTVGTLTVVAYNELLRLHHARRRGAAIDDEVYQGSAVGLGVLALVSVVAVAAAEALDSAERSWLWMALAAGLVAGSALLFTALPRRRRSVPGNRRWQPGARIPPQPLGRSDHNR